MKKLMKRAWKIAKKLEGDLRARLSVALKQAWQEKKMSNFERRYYKKGLSDYVVVRETEKAILVEADACRYKNIFKTTFWCPKSQIKDGVIPEWIISRVEVEKNIDII